MISGITFKALIHFQFIFVYDIMLKFHSLACVCAVCSSLYSEETFFLVVCYVVLCSKSIDYISMVLFLQCLLCSIDLYVCF